MWSLPESELRLLGDVAGRDVLEYGCGAAAWAIALARGGARVTGLDNSARQLTHARAAVADAGVDVTLVHAAGEATPFADDSFDIVFCDHGAVGFAAPEATIPEVARILRPGGSFVFSVEHPVHAMAATEDAIARVLNVPYFELDRFVDPDDGSVSHSRPISTYVTLLIENGFRIERFLEPRPAPDATTTYEGYVTHAWARDFPAELIIAARREPR